MKRNILYFLILAVLGALVYYFVFVKGTSTLGVNERNFSVNDTSDIGRIFIADMQGNKLDVVRQEKVWVVNNKFPARKDAVNMMLTTLKNMTVRYPVPDASINHVVKDLSGNNKKVEIYNRKGEMIKAIYMGGAPLDDIGTYMLIDGSKKPFVVEIPGFVGILNTRFIVDETDMRSRTIISIPFPALAEIRVDYTERPDSSFTVNVQKRDSFLIYNPITKAALPASQVNKEKVFNYIDFLKQVNCEGFANNVPKDSIISEGPFAVVTITLRDKTQQVVKLYRRAVDRRSKSQSTPEGLPLIHDLDRFYGMVNDKEFVLLQEFHFGKLLRSVNYFKK